MGFHSLGFKGKDRYKNYESKHIARLRLCFRSGFMLISYKLKGATPKEQPLPLLYSITKTVYISRPEALVVSRFTMFINIQAFLFYAFGNPYSNRIFQDIENQEA